MRPPFFPSSLSSISLFFLDEPDRARNSLYRLPFDPKLSFSEAPLSLIRKDRSASVLQVSFRRSAPPVSPSSPIILASPPSDKKIFTLSVLPFLPLSPAGLRSEKLFSQIFTRASVSAGSRLHLASADPTCGLVPPQFISPRPAFHRKRHLLARHINTAFLSSRCGSICVARSPSVSFP